MVGIIIHYILFSWFHYNQIPLLQGVETVKTVAKEVDSWTASMIVTAIAVVSTYALYRLAVFHHKDKIEENKQLRSQIKKILTHENKELKRCQEINRKYREENKQLKNEIISYLIKSASKDTD